MPLYLAPGIMLPPFCYCALVAAKAYYCGGHLQHSNRRTRTCAGPVAVVATGENNSTKAAAALDITVTSSLP
jgi:hypothetical protein